MSNHRIADLCRTLLAKANITVVDDHINGGSEFATAFIVACGCVENPAWDMVTEDADATALVFEAHEHIEKYFDEIVNLLVDDDNEYHLTTETLLTIQLRAIVRALKMADDVDFGRFI